MIKKIRNISGQTQTWNGRVLENNAEVVFTDSDDEHWIDNDEFMNAIRNEQIEVSDGVTTSTGEDGARIFGSLHGVGNSLFIDHACTITSATAAGVPGRICWDSNYIYICVAANTWKRAALSTW